MNTSAGSVIRIHLKDKWAWFYIPWIILLSSFVVNLLVASLIAEEDGMTTGGLLSIFIYMFFAGIFSLTQSFPFALGFGVRRKDYLLGTGLMTISMSAMISLILVLLSVIEHRLTGGWGVQLNFFYMSFMNDVNLGGQFLLYFLLIFHLYASGFVISSIYRRFGRNGMLMFWIGLLLVGTLFGYIAYYQGWWMGLFQWLIGLSAVEIIHRAMLWMAILSVVYCWIAYMFIRRASV